MPLTKICDGMRVRLLSINGGGELQARLAAMGLIPGVEIRVLRNSMYGPLIIKVKESCLVLGRGMAHSIAVE